MPKRVTFILYNTVALYDSIKNCRIYKCLSVLQRVPWRDDDADTRASHVIVDDKRRGCRAKEGHHHHVTRSPRTHEGELWIVVAPRNCAFQLESAV